MNKKGFSLVELIVSILILSVVMLFVGIAYVSSLNLIDSNRNLSLAYAALRQKAEELRTGDFDDVTAQTFYPENFAAGRAKGVVSVTDIDPRLKDVRIVICWRTKNRVIGEDEDLDGVLDADEDDNNNGLIDSPCVMQFSLANR